MRKRPKRMPPAWLLGAVATGTLVASGIYIGAIRAWGVTTERVIAASAFGVAGVILIGMVAATARGSARED